MNYSKFIDHTCLKQDATKSQIITLCKDAIEYDFMSVCVNPSYVPLAYSLLKDSSVKVCTVIGFPLGMTSTSSKIKETEIALRDGASEIDMVINVGRLKDKDNDYVLNEIRKIKEVCGSNILKVIVETCLLTDEEIVRVCNLAKEAKADFVKTSTGFSTSGATIHAVKIMRETVGKNMGVKASGGIKTKEDMLLMIEAGASRIGTSNGVAIIKNIK